MPLSVRNIQAIRDKDPQLGEALDDVLGHIQSVMTQTNSSPNGQTQAPPAPSSLKVIASQGIFDAAITDNAPVNRGINYFLQYSSTPGFNAPTTIDLGQSRNHRVHLGNQILYWRAHSSYPTGPISGHAYHGSEGNPMPVIGGGAFTGPTPQASQGSGTSSGAEPANGGFGNSPYRGQRPTGL